ncbi:MATH and LRR domain-containing protein PFE0570w-like [Harmonia axyridis]|uniref:MATH and LRR domain-containing protein PFE0570w-like n=1 Tax=Harmonia axyridis TaxID=115357 RepID=UPI001E274E75|nr:MATH and LRR domain-containing protein PFE0570w-like [Harmonia axyridis]
MRKFQKFMFISNESKLCSETKDPQILPKIDIDKEKTIMLLTRKHIPAAKIDIERTSSMKNKFEIEICKHDGTRCMKTLRKKSQDKLILYKHPNTFDTFTYLTRIHHSFAINSMDHMLRTDWGQFMTKRTAGNSLKLWSDNSRDLLVDHPSLITYQNGQVSSEDIINKDISKLPLDCISFNIESLNGIGHHSDNLRTNTSKFSLCLKEISDENEDKDATPRKDVIFGISKNFKSCTAVIEKKKFSYKPSPKKNETKVLVLSHQNFVKFKKTFTRLLAKNKLKTVEPLLQNLKNPDQIMTKLERALVNHNLRMKNNDDDIIKKNIIMLSSELIENIQLDLNKENDDTHKRRNNPILNIKNLNSRISDGNSGITKKVDNILIVNDEIFKNQTADEWDKSRSDLTEENKCKVIYLNHAVFKDLKKDVIYQILNRKYSSFSNQAIENSPKNSVEKNCSTYRDIPIDHLIAAVAETKRSEYVQRSKLSWQVFKKLEEILRKAEILDFKSPRNESDQNYDKDIKQKVEKSVLDHKPTSYNLHKCEKSKRKKKVKSIQECGSNELNDRSDGIYERIEVIHNAKRNIGRPKSENIIERKIREDTPNSKTNGSKKEGKLFEIKAKNDIKLKNKSIIEMEIPKKKKKKQDEIISRIHSAQMKNTSSKKKFSLADSKEEFRSSKKLDNLSFSEKKNSQTKCLVKNNKKSSSSSSYKELIADSIEKTKKKIKKLSYPVDKHSNKRKDSNSKDLADETETKLVVEELLARSSPPKTPKQHLVKNRSKIPILGTPTTIKNYIEKVATIALASKDIQEKLKMKKSPEAKKLEMENAKNKKKERVERIESNVKSSKIDEQIKSNFENFEKNKKGNSKSRRHIELRNNERGNEILQIDEILALNSSSILNKENENLTTNNELRKKKKTSEEIGPKEQNPQLIKISDDAETTNVENEHLFQNENISEENNSTPPQNLCSGSDGAKMEIEKNKLSDENFHKNTGDEYEISSQMDLSETRKQENDANDELNQSRTIEKNKSNLKYTVGFELEKIAMEGLTQQEHKKTIPMFIHNEGRDQSRDESDEKLKIVTMKQKNNVISMKNIEHFIRGTFDHDETETFQVEDKISLRKDMKERKYFANILNDVYQDNCTEQRKINEPHSEINEHNKINEQGNSESQKNTLTDIEIIRRKRLVYFEDFMKNRSLLKPPEENKLFNFQDNMNPNETANMENSIPDHGIQSIIERIDKDIDTKIQCENENIDLKTGSKLCETETTGNHKILDKSEDDNVIVIKAARSASKEKFGSFQDITKSFLKQVQSNLNFIMEYPKKYKEISVKLKRSQDEFERNVSTLMQAICQEAEKLKKKHSKFEIITKKSRELLNKFTNTSSKKRPTFKPNQKFKMNIVQKLNSKMKLFKESTIDKLNPQMYSSNTKRKSMKKKGNCNFKGKRIEEQTSPCLSISNIQTRSIGSLFADLVASALTKCGDSIISKYSDSIDKLPSKTMNRNIDTMTNLEESEIFIRNDQKICIQKDVQFLSDNEIKQVVYDSSLERNDSNSIFNENCEGYGNLQSRCEKSMQTQKTSPISYESPDEQEFLEEKESQISENIAIKQDRKKSKIYSQKRMIGDTFQNIDQFSTVLKNNGMECLKSYKDIYLDDPNKYDVDSNIAMKTAESFISNLVSDKSNPLSEGKTSLTEKLSNIRTNNEFQTEGSCEQNKHTEQKYISILESEKTIFSLYNTSIDSKNSEKVQKAPRSFQEVCSDDSSGNNFNIKKICSSNNSNSLNLSEFKPSGKFKSLEISDQNPDIGCEISNGMYETQENQTRKDEIELACKLSDHPNSLVCREKKQDEVRSVLRRCVSLDKTAQKVLQNSYKFENITEIFLDLEHMGKSIFKSIFPKNEILSNKCIDHRIPKDSRKQFINENSCNSCTSSREKKHMELLMDIRNKALENEEFFDAENNDYEVLYNDDSANNKEIRKNRTAFIYEDIIKSSEFNEDRKEGLSVDPEENPSNRKRDSYNNNENSIGRKSVIIINDIGATSQILIRKDSFILASENILEDKDRTISLDNYTEKIVFEVDTEQNSTEHNSKSNLKHNDVENELLSFEIEEGSKLSRNLTNNNEESETMTAQSEKPEFSLEKRNLIETSELRNEKNNIEESNKTKKHKILEKFARIKKQQDESVFEITDAVQFDRTKKQIFQSKKVSQRLRKNILSERKQERDEKIINIGKHSLPSKEVCSPLDTKNSDTDFKNLLLQNPKKLIEIASSIMSKSQYLSFLLDVKSTKDLKSHWIDKIKKAISPTESMKKLDNVGKENDGKIYMKNRKNKMLSERAISPTKTQFSASKKSNLGEDKKNFHLDIDNFRAIESQMNSGFHYEGNQKESISSRNSNIENEYSWNYSENDPLPYSLMRYLDIPLQETHVEKTEKYESFDQLITSGDVSRKEIEKVRNEKRNKDECINSSIDLPRKESIKMSDKIFEKPVSLMEDKSEITVIENISDRLSNCSGPVSSIRSEEVFHSNSPIYTQSVRRTLQECPTESQNTKLDKKKFNEPLKKNVENHENAYPSIVTKNLPTIENTDISCNCLNDERKIRVVSTKSLSEVLEEDPDLLKKLRHKKMMIKQPTVGEPSKKFEYRFHDFRKTEDRCEQLKTKRQQEHKKVLLDKFKCLIQARKVATERNRQKLRLENQQLKPKVLEKINYFQELEISPNSDIKTETVEEDNSSVPIKKKKVLYKKRKRINEDELVTLVQNHPSVPVKVIATEIVEKCDTEKQNVIHIPWMPTCGVDAKN